MKPLTIVGVIANQADRSVGGDVQPLLLIPYQQVPTTSLFYQALLKTVVTFVVKTRGVTPIAPEMRSVFKQTAPDYALDNFQTMQESVDANTFSQRLGLYLVGSFAGLATVMVIAGLYGVLAQLVSYRRREIGVRMALGATREGIARMVVRQGGVLIVAGLVAGLVLVGFRRATGEEFSLQCEAHRHWNLPWGSVRVAGCWIDRLVHTRIYSVDHRADGGVERGLTNFRSRVNREELHQFVHDFIATRKYGVISSVGPRGEPQSALVGIAVSDELEIVFDTVTTSRKYPNLRLIRGSPLSLAGKASRPSNTKESPSSRRGGISCTRSRRISLGGRTASSARSGRRLLISSFVRPGFATAISTRGGLRRCGSDRIQLCALLNHRDLGPLTNPNREPLCAVQGEMGLLHDLAVNAHCAFLHFAVGFG